jgi:hypothetical protein
MADLLPKIWWLRRIFFLNSLTVLSIMNAHKRLLCTCFWTQFQPKLLVGYWSGMEHRCQ